MISTRTAAANESQAGPKLRGPLIIKPRNIQTQKLMSRQRPKQTKNVEHSTGKRGHQDNLSSETEKGDKLILSEQFAVTHRQSSCVGGS